MPTCPLDRVIPPLALDRYQILDARNVFVRIQHVRMPTRSSNFCSCFGPFGSRLHRVTIALTNENKHALPVEEGCRFARPNGIVRNQPACRPLEGDREPESYTDLVRCTRDSACRIGQGRFQADEEHLHMSVMRDPR